MPSLVTHPLVIREGILGDNQDHSFTLNFIVFSKNYACGGFAIFTNLSTQFNLRFKKMASAGKA